MFLATVVGGGIVLLCGAAWEPAQSGTRGGQRKYSDLAIETALTLRLIFHLPLRQAEGFLNSLLAMMTLDLSTPLVPYNPVTLLQPRCGRTRP
jgi:hypothetical protein